MSDLKRYNSQEAYVYDVQRYPMATVIPDPTEWVRFEDTQAAIKAAVEAERAKWIAAFPTNWLDPLLSGPDKVLRGEYDCRNIEALIEAIRARGKEPEQ